MRPTKKTFVKPPKARMKYVRIFLFLTLTICFAGVFLVTRIPFSVKGNSYSSNSANDINKTLIVAPEKTPGQIPPQKQILRIKTAVAEVKEISLDSEIKSLVVVSPEIAAAHIKNGRALVITGLKTGETLLIITDGGQTRRTLIVEVGGKSAASERRHIVAEQVARKEIDKTSGSYNLAYVAGFDENPSLLRQTVEYRRALSGARTLRISGETFKFIDRDERRRALVKAQSYGLNRISIGIDSPDKTIDFLDSQVKISPLSLNNYRIRGFHLVTTPKAASAANFKREGIEVFSGFAQPSLAFYDEKQGKIAGAMLPVAAGKSWQARAGFIIVEPQKNSRYNRGGTVLQANATYAPNKKISAYGETAFANGGLSWGARLDLKLKQFGAFGEIVRFDKDSPLNGVGAQSGGRKSEAFSFNWRPDTRFAVSAGFNHARVTRFANSRFGDFERSTLFANFNYKISRASRLNFRFIDQKIEIAVPGGAKNFQIEARRFVAGHNIRFNQNWTNNFEAAINFSRETRAAADLENGFNLTEQLRFSWKRNSVTGFFNYARNTPTLASLLIRNPQLLSPVLQSAFVLDPALFLQTYRDRIGFLLPGVELPQSRNLDAGILFQKTVSRFTLLGETRYGAGEISSQNQNNFYVSLGLGVRFDNANSFQINGWHSFGANGQNALVFSFTHRFGADAGSGFQFSKLLGFGRGKIKGRVYYDLNGNGQDDEGEPGVAGATVQLNENRSAKTDAGGQYRFSADEGGHDIALISNDLGVRLRASTATRQRISLASGKTLNVSFGVMDSGFVSGRVFNDLNLTGEMPPFNAPGIKGVRIILRSVNAAGNVLAEQMTNAVGGYEFRNLRSGDYQLEIDKTTLPANFRFPAQTSWKIKVEPLQGFYFDIPLAAQRAVAGIVFVDTDGDGKFNPQKDSPIEGAIVSAGGSVAVSGGGGAYILRNLPAGNIKILVRSPQGIENSPVVVNLDGEPTTKREVNIFLQR